MKPCSHSQQSAPSVFPLLPCCKTLSSQQEVTMGCLSTGYLPNQLDVQWNGGSITSGVKNFPAVLGKNGDYLSVSRLTVYKTEWDNKPYECNVLFKPTGAKITKKMPECTTKKTPPTVEVMQSSCGESGSVDLVCLISNYTPNEISIQWLLNGQQTSISPTNTTPYRDNDGNFGSSSRVSVPHEDWNTGDIYTCRVNHPATSTKNEDKIKKCIESSGMHPKVVLLPPSPKDLLITMEPKLICLVSQMDSPSSLAIKWSRSDGKKAVAYNSGPDQEYDGTYKYKSTLRVSLADWNSEKSFTCTVQHDDLPVLIEKTIQKREEFATEPVIYIYPPAAEELLVNDFVTLICLVKRFNPKHIFIQWKRNGVVQDEDYYRNTEPIQEEDEESYFMYSRLTIEKSDWNRGATYTCIGVHKNITSKDIKKSRAEYIIWDCSSEDDEDSLWSTAATFITLFLISVFYSATITIVKVKWFISRILQFDRHDHFVTVLDSVTQGGE